MDYAHFVLRSERRVRLLFTGALAPAAFGSGVAILGLYALACTDGSGQDPVVSAAIVVPDAPNAVELALDLDLVAGGAYALTLANVPGADASLASASDVFVFGAQAAPPVNTEASQDDIDALVYGVDLVWTGTDFGETATGDLATVAGVPNVTGAQVRRLTNEDGLPWAANYGAQAGRFIYGASPGGGGLLGILRRQSVADDRIASGAVEWTEDPASPGDEYFRVTQTLRGAGATTSPLQTNVSLPQGGGA
ncbi:MAG TPA: hypothetical protein VGI39_39800 [Polyangiaceae bacterium]|jgi:hypothetical protein